MTTFDPIALHRDLFHLCGPILERGSVILPGNWGRILRLYGWRHAHSIREHALEEARKALAPHLPSRLACAFVFLSRQEAEAFRGSVLDARQSGFAAHVLYRVRLLDPSAPWFLTDGRNVSPTDTHVAWPRNYWLPLAEPWEVEGRQDSERVRSSLSVGHRELLTLSRLTVEECLDRV